MYLSLPQSHSSFFSKMFVVAALAVAPLFSEAFYMDGPINIGGYAWSSTIGWISMGNGGSEQVTINADGTVTGYAWSENIGWIRFGGLGGFPTDGGTTAQNARLHDVGDGNFELRGWARACAGAATVSSCSGGTNANSGGWDGWIALSGDTHSVIFSGSGPATGSYAWGSSVVGWVDMFSHVALDLPPSATLGLNGCTIALGESACNGSRTFEFTGVTVSNNPRIERRIPEPITTVSSGQLSGTNVPTTMRHGLNRYRALTDGNSDLVTSTITISCVANASPIEPGGVCACSDGHTENNGMCDEIPREMTITVDRPLIRQGESVEVRIEIAGSNPYCTIAGPGVTGSDNPIVNPGEPIIESTTYTYRTAALFNLARFSLTCSGVYSDEQTRVMTVQVIPSFREQ